MSLSLATKTCQWLPNRRIRVFSIDQSLMRNGSENSYKKKPAARRHIPPVVRPLRATESKTATPYRHATSKPDRIAHVTSQIEYAISGNETQEGCPALIGGRRMRNIPVLRELVLPEGTAGYGNKACPPMTEQPHSIIVPHSVRKHGFMLEELHKQRSGSGSVRGYATHQHQKTRKDSIVMAKTVERSDRLDAERHVSKIKRNTINTRPQRTAGKLYPRSFTPLKTLSQSQRSTLRVQIEKTLGEPVTSKMIRGYTSQHPFHPLDYDALLAHVKECMIQGNSDTPSKFLEESMVVEWPSNEPPRSHSFGEFLNDLTPVNDLELKAYLQHSGRIPCNSEQYGIIMNVTKNRPLSKGWAAPDESRIIMRSPPLGTHMKVRRLVQRTPQRSFRTVAFTPKVRDHSAQLSPAPHDPTLTFFTLLNREKRRAAKKKIAISNLVLRFCLRHVKVSLFQAITAVNLAGRTMLSDQSAAVTKHISSQPREQFRRRYLRSPRGEGSQGNTLPEKKDFPRLGELLDYLVFHKYGRYYLHCILKEAMAIPTVGFCRHTADDVRKIMKESKKLGFLIDRFGRPLVEHGLVKAVAAARPVQQPTFEELITTLFPPGIVSEALPQPRPAEFFFAERKDVLSPTDWVLQQTLAELAKEFAKMKNIGMAVEEIMAAPLPSSVHNIVKRCGLRCVTERFFERAIAAKSEAAKMFRKPSPQRTKPLARIRIRRSRWRKLTQAGSNGHALNLRFTLNAADGRRDRSIPSSGSAVASNIGSSSTGPVKIKYVLDGVCIGADRVDLPSGPATLTHSFINLRKTSQNYRRRLIAAHNSHGNVFISRRPTKAYPFTLSLRFAGPSKGLCNPKAPIRRVIQKKGLVRVRRRPSHRRARRARAKPLFHALDKAMEDVVQSTDALGLNDGELIPQSYFPPRAWDPLDSISKDVLENLAFDVEVPQVSYSDARAKTQEEHDFMKRKLDETCSRKPSKPEAGK